LNQWKADQPTAYQPSFSQPGKTARTRLEAVRGKEFLQPLDCPESPRRPTPPVKNRLVPPCQSVVAGSKTRKFGFPDIACATARERTARLGPVQVKKATPRLRRQSQCDVLQSATALHMALFAVALACYAGPEERPSHPSLRRSEIRAGGVAVRHRAEQSQFRVRGARRSIPRLGPAAFGAVASEQVWVRGDAPGDTSALLPSRRCCTRGPKADLERPETTLRLYEISGAHYPHGAWQFQLTQRWLACPFRDCSRGARCQAKSSLLNGLAHWPSYTVSDTVTMTPASGIKAINDWKFGGSAIVRELADGSFEASRRPLFVGSHL
jgi:hypothetical protein